MNFFTWIKSILGSSIEAPKAKESKFVKGPLGIAIERMIKIDDILLNSLESKIKMPIPSSLEQAVYAAGVIELGHGMQLHRYYFDDSETWLQVTTSGTGQNSVENITLFVYVSGETPTSEDELKRLAGPQSLVGLKTYDYEGMTYDREWGSEPGQTNLVSFDERVENAAGASYPVKLSSMLYKRDIPGTERSEMILISVEEGEENDITVSTAVGISLLESDITII
jgi:hypothetical protein